MSEFLYDVLGRRVAVRDAAPLSPEHKQSFIDMVSDPHDGPAEPVLNPPVEGRRQFDTGAVRSTDTDHVRYDLVSPYALRRLAARYKMGADKYGDGNYLKGFPVHDVLNHTLNHLFLYMAEGNRNDDNLAAAMWNIATIIHFEETKREELFKGMVYQNERYDLLERKHLGDPDKKTGIYHPDFHKIEDEGLDSRPPIRKDFGKPFHLNPKEIAADITYKDTNALRYYVETVTLDIYETNIPDAEEIERRATEWCKERKYVFVKVKLRMSPVKGG
jgi:hypothetical protein